MTHPEPAATAFERLTRRIANLDDSGWRLARFSPPPNLPIAQLWFQGRDSFVAGEVLDLSSGGICLAVHQGINVEAGSPCRVVVTMESGESLTLRGSILRVESFQMINLLVLVPEEDDNPGQ
ncbi:MAG: hypothetical protein ACKO6F_09710 [Cyanobium sp.]